jgi:hypothetical protein
MPGMTVHETQEMRSRGMAGQARGDRKIAGVSVGGIVVIVGLVIAFAFSFVLGIVIAVIGLAAFGGFVRGKWY